MVIIILSGCGEDGNGLFGGDVERSTPSGAGPDFPATLSIAVSPQDPKAGEVVRFRIELVPLRQVELQFSDAQRFDFTVTRDGETIWRWSEGKAFAQVLGSEIVYAGSNLVYEADWTAGPPGNYEVTGLIATPIEPELSVGKTFMVV